MDKKYRYTAGRKRRGEERLCVIMKRIREEVRRIEEGKQVKREVTSKREEVKDNNLICSTSIKRAIKKYYGGVIF